MFNISKNTSHPFSSHVWGWLRGNFLCLNSLRGIAQASAASAKFPTHGGPKTAILAGVRLSSWCLSERIGFTMIHHCELTLRLYYKRSLHIFEKHQNVWSLSKCLSGWEAYAADHAYASARKEARLSARSPTPPATRDLQETEKRRNRKHLQPGELVWWYVKGSLCICRTLNRKKTKWINSICSKFNFPSIQAMKPNDAMDFSVTHNQPAGPPAITKR